MVFNNFVPQKWEGVINDLTIEAIQIYCYQLLYAVEYLQSKGILHRYIIWDNLYLSEDRFRIIIGGFDRAVMLYDSMAENDGKITGFSPPEMIFNTQPGFNCNVDFSADVWSVGCALGSMMFKKAYIFGGAKYPRKLLYKIITFLGTAEFQMYTNTDKRKDFFHLNLYDNIEPADIASLTNASNIDSITNDGIDLLKGLLQVDPSNRLTPKRAMQHSFFKNCDIDFELIYHKRNSKSYYKIRAQQRLGSGALCHVYKITEDTRVGEQKSRRELAVKFVTHRKLGFKHYDSTIKREIKILKRLRGCRNIVEIHGVIHGGTQVR